MKKNEFFFFCLASPINNEYPETFGASLRIRSALCGFGTGSVAIKCTRMRVCEDVRMRGCMLPSFCRKTDVSEK